MKRLAFIGIVLIILVSIMSVPVAAKGPETEVWNVPGDFNTIQEAIDSADVVNGDTIRVGKGNHAGALVTKAVTIVGTGGAIIDDGPNSHSFLRAGFLFADDGAGSGATIRGFTFIGDYQSSYVDDGKLDFPIFSRGADDVTIEHNTMITSLQAITNWGGSGWVISHNDITDLGTLNGGGIGIFIGETTGGIVENNAVSHNKIRGVLHVWESDGGEYSGSGIVLYANFRWGAAGAEAIKNNIVVHNKVSMVSDNSEVVDIVAFEMTENWYPADPPDPTPIVIYDNAIGFNDFRGTEIQIVLTPEELEDYNSISRNLGENRGRGLHPSIFK